MKPMQVEKQRVLDTITQVQLAIKSRGVYPEDHPATTEILQHSYRALVALLNGRSVLTLSADGGRLLVDEVPLESPNPGFANLARELEERTIESISFYRGLSLRDYLLFIQALSQRQRPHRKSGGIESFLRQNGVSTIRLNRVKYGKVSGNQKGGARDRAVTAGPAQGRSGETHAADLDHDPRGPAVNTVAAPNDDANADRQDDARGRGPGEPPAPLTAADHPRGQEPSAGEGKRIAACIEDLLSGRNSGELAALIGDLSRKMDDKSGEIRGKIAESLQAMTTALDEFDCLKDNFQKTANTLVTWVKEENHVDTYLAVTKSLQNLCSAQSLNKLDSYLIGDTIGGRLFEANEVSRAGLQEALKERRKNGNSLQYNLAALNLVNETVLIHHLAQQYKNCRIVVLSAIEHIEEGILRTIPEKYVRRYQVLPFKTESGSLYTAMKNPDDWQLTKDIRFITGSPVVPHLAAEYYLLNSIEKFYNIKTAKPGNHQAMTMMQQEDWNSDLELVEEKQEALAYGEELRDSDAPIIKLANVIIEEAIKQKASDIHIEPYEHELRVRLRIDGTLTTVLDPAKSYANGLASRIKIMSGLDISERRLPQDGRFKVRKDGKVVDFRVSTFPGMYGEKIVLRLLDSAGPGLDIRRLGLNDNDLTLLLSAMYKSKGMILVTGPTGSGKTTTIYSMLRGLNDGTLNISTAEDPIEYNLQGINQFQMNTKIGLNFARALRTFLRQDPDIIMVGEIRDFETAEIAFKAALTGHLVLSTLHTNNAPETITRLLNIGIEPYMIASSVNLIVAQRLMRKICERCRVEVAPTELQETVFRSYGIRLDGHRYFRGEGCDECGNTGYKGRCAVYEVLPLGDRVQETILQGGSAAMIRARAEERGFASLQTQGFSNVTAGITSLTEWMRVLA